MKDWFGRGIWFLVGMFLVIMGLYFLIHPDATLVSIAWLLGAAMLVSGVSDLVVYLARHRAYIASGWFLADGIIDLLLGLLFVCNSWLAAELLPYALAGWAILSGVIKCVGAAIYRRAGMFVLGRAAGDRSGHTGFRPGDLFQAGYCCNRDIRSGSGCFDGAGTDGGDARPVCFLPASVRGEKRAARRSRLFFAPVNRGSDPSRSARRRSFPGRHCIWKSAGSPKNR